MTSAVQPRPYPWIVSPFIDVIFVCGGGVFMLLLLNILYLGWTAPANTGSDPASWWIFTLVLLGNYIFADAHNSATYWRIWGSEEDRARFKFHRTWLVYITIGFFAIGLARPDLTGIYVYLYMLTVFWHYSMQSYGIALIYCYKQGYVMSNFEKNSFRWFVYALIGLIASRNLCFKPESDILFGVKAPFWGPLNIEFFHVARYILILTTVVFVFALVRKYFREGRICPWQALMLIGTITCMALARDLAKGLFLLFVPAFFHGSQYIAVCLSYYLKERGLPDGLKAWDLPKTALGGPGIRYFGLTVLSGLFFYVGIPHFCGQIGFDRTNVTALVLACVNFHHFVTDAAIWRLKDKHCRSILIA